MRAIGGLWRWRHNPLRRATDLASRPGWRCWPLLLLLPRHPSSAPGRPAPPEDALQQAVRDQREARHLVTATVVRKLARSPAGSPTPSRPSRGQARGRVQAAGRRPDGTSQHGTVIARASGPRVPAPSFGLWTDGQGRTSRPPAGHRHRDGARGSRGFRRDRSVGRVRRGRPAPDRLAHGPSPVRPLGPGLGRGPDPTGAGRATGS